MPGPASNEAGRIAQALGTSVRRRAEQDRDEVCFASAPSNFLFSSPGSCVFSLDAQAL